MFRYFMKLRMTFEFQCSMICAVHPEQYGPSMCTYHEANRPADSMPLVQTLYACTQ